MAEPDCEICKMMGLRACDKCGNPIPGDRSRDAFGIELCASCPAPQTSPAPTDRITRSRATAARSVEGGSFSLSASCRVARAGIGDGGLGVIPSGMPFGINRRKYCEIHGLQLRPAEWS